MAYTSLGFDIFVRDRASKDFNKIGRSIDDTEKKTSRLGTAFKNLAKAGAALGGIALLSFANQSIKAAIELQKVQAQTQAVLKSTGGAANVTAGHVRRLSAHIEGLTATDELLVQKGANVLLTFKDIRNEAGKGNKIFDQSVKVVTDMSRALGTDMKSSAIQVGKALNDPIKGMSALQRVGVTFTDQQEKVITKLVESGHKMKAQKIILQELKSEFGGSGRAYGKTFAGQVELAKDAVEDAGRALAQKLLPFLTKIVQKVPAIVDALSNFGGWVKKNRVWIIALATAVGTLYTATKIYDAFLTVKAAGGLLAYAKNTRIVVGVTKAWRLAQLLLNAAMKANVLGIVITAVVAIGTALVVAYKKSETFRKIVNKAFDLVKGAAKAVVGFFTNRLIPFFTKTIPHAFQRVVGWLKKHWSDVLVGILTGPIGLAVKYIVQHWDKVREFFKKVWGGIVGFFKDKVMPVIKKVGTVFLNVGEGIIKGWAWVVDKVTGGVRTILNVMSKIPGPVGDAFAKARDAVDRFRTNFGNNTDRVIKSIEGMKDKMNSIPKKTRTDAEFHDDKARAQMKGFTAEANRRLKQIKDENVNVDLSTRTKKILALIADNGAGGSSRPGNSFWRGGPISGPGTETSDSIPALLSRGEHVWSAREVRGAGGHQAVERMRAAARKDARGTSSGQYVAGYAMGGAVTASDPWALIPDVREHGLRGAVGVAARRFRKLGRQISRAMSRNINSQIESMFGLGRAIQFAYAQRGKPYIWGGVGPRGYDCSGFQSAITNVLMGRPPHNRLFATGSMASALPHLGFKPGMGGRGDYSVGWYTGSPGHTAGTLGTINVESAGGVGVRVGSRARGARNFARRMHLNVGTFGSVGRLPGGSGVKRWAGVVITALRALGAPVSLVDEVLSRMARESGGDPHSQNNWDSNAAKGQPSKGLMQVIPSTFKAYAGPYRRLGIWNPLANIYAGLNWARHRWGSIRYAMLKPGGYDDGGFLNPGVNLAVNKTGKPEAVLTQKQWKQIDKLIESIAENFGKKSHLVKAAKELRQDLHHWVRGSDRLLGRLSRIMAKRDEFAKSVSDPFRDNSELFGEGATTRSVADQLATQRASARAMLRALRRARGKGLSGGLFNLLAQSGNLNAAQGFANAAPMEISDLEALFKGRNNAADALGKFAGRVRYGQDIHEVRRILHHRMAPHLHEILKHLRKLNRRDEHKAAHLRDKEIRKKAGVHRHRNRRHEERKRRREKRRHRNRHRHHHRNVAQHVTHRKRAVVPVTVGGFGKQINIEVKVLLDGRELQKSLLRVKRKNNTTLGLN